jgi:diguanylate cyclase (GGDEF)-like protein
VLVEMARGMRGCLRSYDAIGRYGGEEFLLVLPNSGPAVAKGLAERIRSVVVDQPFELGDGSDAGLVRMSISLGVVTLAEPHPLPAQELIRVADRALYSVKDRGGNGVAWEAFTEKGRGPVEANREIS